MKRNTLLIGVSSLILTSLFLATPATSGYFGITAWSTSPTTPASSSSGIILFTSLNDGKFVVKSLELQEGKVSQLTSEKYESYDPSWSPDNKQIAFVSNKDGHSEIYTMLPDGSDIHRITNSSMDESFPSWSPDGQKLVYQAITASNPNPEQPQLHVIDIKSLKTVQLTDGPGGNYDPSWSPNGEQIVFMSDRDGNPEIYSMNLGDAQTYRLTYNAAPDSRSEDYDPSWSPNGEQITFYSFRDGEWEIYIMDSDGQNTHCATCDQIGGKSPAWSPDGSEIAFIDDSDGHICIVRISNGRTNCLENTDAVDTSWNLDWSS